MLLDSLDFVAFPGVEKEMLLRRKIKVAALTFVDYGALGKTSITSVFCLSSITWGE